MNIIVIILTLIFTYYILKYILRRVNSPKEPIQGHSCNQLDLGFNHYTTGIVAEEILSNGGEGKETYQFRCPSTQSAGWVTGVKTGGVVVMFDCCGKPYATFTAPQLKRLLFERS